MALFPAPALVLAQTGAVEGTVSDSETGEPLPGATVVVQGTELGTAADADGSFTIDNIPEGTYTLRASFVGYRAQEQEVTIVSDETVTINFSLERDDNPNL